ncbi:MAG: hypothetical protein QOF58_7575 [Pseudonocardiales bacterium]|nr:hypothetical protein [Pseudonocardiales bacterium]
MDVGDRDGSTAAGTVLGEEVVEARFPPALDLQACHRVAVIDDLDPASVPAWTACASNVVPRVELINGPAADAVTRGEIPPGNRRITAAAIIRCCQRTDARLGGRMGST